MQTSSAIGRDRIGYIPSGHKELENVRVAKARGVMKTAHTVRVFDVEAVLVVVMENFDHVKAVNRSETCFTYLPRLHASIRGVSWHPSIANRVEVGVSFESTPRSNNCCTSSWMMACMIWR